MPQQSTASDPLDQHPEPLQQLHNLRQAAAFGIVILALLLLLLAFSLIASSLQNDVTQVEATLIALQADLLQLQTPSPAIQAMMTTLTTTQALADQIQASAPPAGIPWPQVVAALDRYDTNRIVLISLTQVDNRITLTGLAANDEVVVAYTRAIEEGNLFAAVMLQSLQIIPAPTATPTPTAPTTPASSPALAVQPPFLATATTLADFVIVIELNQ